MEPGEYDLPEIEDGVFSYSLDGFCINGFKREEGSRLRKHFLPQMTSKAKKMLRDPDFVFNQLQHYDIEYDESQNAGSDAVQLKRALQAGKLDEVPSEMREIEAKMELQWLAALPPTALSSDPEYFVERRFLDEYGDLAPHKLDASKLVTVEYSSSKLALAAKLIEAANKVDGLYALGARSEPHQVFISRNENLVRAAAGITEVRNARLLDLAQRKSDAEEQLLSVAQKKTDAEEQHKRLLSLATIAADTEHQHTLLLDSPTYTPSPIGRYTIDAPTLNGVTCPDPRKLSLSISSISTGGVFGVLPSHRIYQATFDLRVAKGVMILCPHLPTLYTFCRQKWGPNVPAKAQAYDSDEPDSDSQPGGGGKRKRPPPTGSVRARKRARRERVPLRYHALLRYRETRSGVIHFVAEGGMVKFGDEEQLEFRARIDLSAALGRGVEMVGRKVGEEEEEVTERWRDYTRARYDAEQKERVRV